MFSDTILILAFLALSAKLALSDDLALPNDVGLPMSPSNDKEWREFITNGILRVKEEFPYAFPTFVRLYPTDGEEISSPKYIRDTEIVLFDELFGRVNISSMQWPYWISPHCEYGIRHRERPRELEWKLPPETPLGPPVGVYEADRLSKAAKFTNPYIFILLYADGYGFGTRAEPDGAWIVLNTQRVIPPSIVEPVSKSYNMTTLLASDYHPVDAIDIAQVS